MLPNELSYLYDWTPNSKLPYGDFLRAKQFEGSIRYGIDNHNKELITTNQQLSEQGIEVLSVNLDRGFTMLSQGIGQVIEAGQEASTEIAGTLNWGFSELLLSQGQMNIPLDALVKLTNTHSQPWACEQFEIGRDEFRRQLYQEALQSVTRAIEGLGSNPGIKTEYRFHFLLGIIRLGSYSNSSLDVINPQLAQQAFLAAAQYAQSTSPADAGQSLICAGRAALVAGDINNAIDHTRKGLSFVPTHAAGMYQLGRALFLKGVSNEATDRLADAILLNVEHALHAAGDPDFISKMDFLNGVLRQAHERYEARYRQVASRFRRAEQTLRGFSFEDVPADDLQLKGFTEIQKTLKSAEAPATTKTLFGYSSAINLLLGGFRLFPTCFEEFKAHCIRRLQEQLLQPPPRREDFPHSNPPKNSQSGRNSRKAGLASGIISGITILLFEGSQLAQPIYRGIVESMSSLFLIPFMSAVGIGAAVTLLEELYREHTQSMHKAALAAFEAAWNTYNNLKNSLEKEIATIQGMSLPNECAPPPKENIVQQGAPAIVPAEQKRVSAWSRL